MYTQRNIDRIEFAKRLINLLRDRNMNQSDLARAAGLTRDAVSTYVRARSMPEPINLAKIAKALGVEPSFFLLKVGGGPTQTSNSPQSPRSIIPAHAANDDDDVIGNLVPDTYNMQILPTGKARVEIIAYLPVEKAAELMAFCGRFRNPKE